MKIYLDTSVYNRPFDDQTQPRIWLETLALALVLQFVEAGEAILVNSTMLEFENSRNPFPLRQEWVLRCLEQAKLYQHANNSIRERAEVLERHGLKAIDSLHVASAESAGADYFLTCDDRLLKKQKYIAISSMNPLDFVQKVIGVQP
ncbi:MAG: PIN domain-containing protein [Anaerolineales bacterium]|nr:PIN domain-containing protein [Anaerolineales bacterium]